MPINWNEVDKARLKYIQNKETIKAEYKKECLACENSFFKFKKPERPDILPFIYNYKYLGLNIFEIYENKLYIKNYHSFLSEEETNKIDTYLMTYKEKDNLNFLYTHVEDNEEGRKKVDKVVALIEKRLDEINEKIKDDQKEAEAFIDNYINGKDTK